MTRKVNLEICSPSKAWCGLSGYSLIEVNGFTKAGNPVQVKLQFSEYALRRLAQEVRRAFRELKQSRDEMDRHNLEVFGE